MNVPGVVYHLISRFVDREWFIASEREREFYLARLGLALSSSDWQCLAFAVMSNHIHLAAIAGEQRLASWIRPAHSLFADWMNRSHDRIGPMFVRGPKDFAVAPERVGSLIAYIHNNPVRANVVRIANGSSWTSHRAYTRAAAAPAWLSVKTGLALSGFADRRAFDRWVTDPQRRPVEQEKEFVEHDNEAGLGGVVVPRAPRAPTTLVRPAPREIVLATASELGLPVTQLCSPRRGSSERVAREVAVRCAEMAGLTGVEIATALNLSQQGVSVIRRRNRNEQRELLEICARVLQRVEGAGAGK